MPRPRAASSLRVSLGVASGHDVALSVSADVELAAAVGAAGVHLQAAAAIAPARERLGDAIIGVSAHSIPDVAEAATAGADYVTLSPIFLTESKPGYGPALGTDVPAARPAAHGFPVLALAGITAATVGACLAAGASGVAMMGEVMRADDAARIVRDLVEACGVIAAREGLAAQKETGDATPGSSV